MFYINKKKIYCRVIVECVHQLGPDWPHNLLGPTTYRKGIMAITWPTTAVMAIILCLKIVEDGRTCIKRKFIALDGNKTVLKIITDNVSASADTVAADCCTHHSDSGTWIDVIPEMTAAQYVD